jgi:hypothetical protein
VSLSLAQLTVSLARAVRNALNFGVLEPQTGNWVNNNLWGDRRSAPLPVAADQQVAVLPKNTVMFGAPAVHSVQLFRSDAILPGNADVRARVTYGCGGVDDSFDLDWLHGCQFSLVCNSVSVVAVSYAPIEALPYDASDASMFVGATLAKGTVAQARCPATYTEQRVVLETPPDPANARRYAVRDFCREVTVHVAENDDATVPSAVQLEFINEGSQTIAIYNAQVCAGGRPVPIPGGATTLIVRTTAGPVIVTVQWFLGL